MQMQQVIDKSECKPHSEKIKFRNNLNKNRIKVPTKNTDLINKRNMRKLTVYLKYHETIVFNLRLGCMDSTESAAIYEPIEKRHTFATKFLQKSLFALIAASFGGSLIFPVSHAIFNYPEPEQWHLLVKLQ